MDTFNRLIVWVAYAAGAIVVGVIAYVGLRYYRPTGDGSATVAARNPDSQTSPNAVSAFQVNSVRGTHIDHLFAQRSQIKRLQALLDQKTVLLEKKTALLERKTAEQLALERKLDEAIALLETLAEHFAKTGERSPDSGVANGELHGDLERLKEQRQESESQAQREEEELKQLVADLTATDEEIAQLRQEAELEFSVLLAEKEAFEAVASRALVTVGSEAVPILIEDLSHSRADIRQWAATVLGEIGADAREAIPPLVGAMSDDVDPGVREAARRSLDMIDPSQQ
ncbi:MAG: HEAT repeat domain-containing protein [Planctomycetes bacterium]|nr:HEAT repeat domain-containing protein [Planctomycetota bacterium]MBL7042965.1 HEAT repeat domain-containing protein [Pirellulaceae bacterium]